MIADNNKKECDSTFIYLATCGNHSTVLVISFYSLRRQVHVL
jgi:hypothetical protein